MDLVFGLARNARLAAEIEAQMAAARAEAEWLPGGSHSPSRSGGKAHSRFVVTSQTPQAAITPDQHRSCGDRPTAPVPLH